MVLGKGETMRSVSYRLDDLERATIPIGFEGENLYTHVNIDCKKVFDEDDGFVPTLVITAPSGEKYPGIVTREGNIVTWEVSASDLIRKGSGELQLAFTHGEVVGKTFVAKTRIERSIIPTGDVPTEIENFIIEAGTIVNGIPQAIDDALAEAKESGMFDGKDGKDGVDGKDGKDGKDGYTPVKGIDYFDGVDGTDGVDGVDGYSPTATVVKVGKTATITITDKNGTTTAQISDGDSGGGGGTSDYNDLSNKPQINSVTLSGNKSLNDLGIASASSVSEKYTKPSGGIPVSDLASGVQTSLGKADSAYQKPSGGIPASDIASGVIPDVSGFYTKPSSGIPASDIADGVIPDITDLEEDVGDLKSAIDAKADISDIPDVSGFYTKPAGGIPASDIANGVIPSVPVQDVQSGGTSILNNGVAEINPVVSVSGTTPSITGAANTRYICGECSTLTITAPASGCVDVTFTSGSTPTVLTVSSAKTGVTAIKWANGFDPSALEANTTYEVNILDGEFGVVGSWT